MSIDKRLTKLEQRRRPKPEPDPWLDRRVWLVITSWWYRMPLSPDDAKLMRRLLASSTPEYRRQLEAARDPCR